MVKINQETADRWGYAGIGAIFSNKIHMSFMLLFGAIALIGYVIGIDGFFKGYHHVYGVTRQVPWGLLISAYIFCVVTSTGLCLVSSIGHVFGYEPYMPVAKRAVFLSITFMLGGFTIIFFDIENPFRMAIYNVISPNLTSNMWWMGTLYGLYLFALVIEYYFLLDQNHSMSRFAGIWGVVFGVAAHSNLGAVFGMLHGREFWYGPYMPIYFIVSAMMSGGAAIIFFTCIAWRMNREILTRRMERAIKAICQLTTMLIAIIMFFTIWKIISGIVAPEKYLAIKAFVIGEHAPLFWIFEVGMGMIIPFFLLLRSKGTNYGMMFSATAMMMVGIFFMRYNLVLAGQIVPVFHGLGVEEYHSLLQYTPSFHEIAVTLAGIFFALAAYIFGEKILNAHQFQKHEIVPAGAFICPGCGGIHYEKEGETREEALQRHHRIRQVERKG